MSKARYPKALNSKVPPSTEHRDGNGEQPKRFRSYPWQYTASRNRPLPKHLYELAGEACFFTVRAFRSSSPFNDPEVADLTVAALLQVRGGAGCEVDVFCLMPDHLHSVVTPVRDGASSLEFIRRAKSLAGYQARQRGFEGKLWQPRWYDHLLTDRENRDLITVADYILNNPVRKGLCVDLASYRWCGIPDSVIRSE